MREMDRIQRFVIQIDYQDPYVEPKILTAFKQGLPSPRCDFIKPSDHLPTDKPTLQWRAYESIDFEHALTHHQLNLPHLINSYVIRKALIRKHYLANIIFSHVTKNPTSLLKTAFPVTNDLELDYAEFLDEALVEAFELRASLEQNKSKQPQEREWWVLKPSMSDRGQGIRLFSTEEELSAIFQGWEAEEPESEDEVAHYGERTGSHDHDIVISHLRHFIAQKYIMSPLLIPEAPFNSRKFHIRTYVVAAGSLNVFVYDHMLALFASETFTPPWKIFNNQGECPSESNGTASSEGLLKSMQNIHLTNTCVQNQQSSLVAKSDHVFLLSQLPLTEEQQEAIGLQIQELVRELFKAAIAHPTNFQALPQAFEVFGFDFLVSTSASNGNNIQVHLLEVNAFPDFAQTGNELGDIVVRGLFEEVVIQIIAPWLGDEQQRSADPEMTTNRHLKRVMKRDLIR